jgi:hypothetical protein
VTFKNSKGITETYDLKHDMTANGALNTNLDNPAKDKEILKAVAAEKL